MMRRKLKDMPYDKTFNNESCHATGYEVCMCDTNNPGDWWVEYIDQKGNYHYGR